MTVRRVDPSQIVQARYEHPDANKREQPSDHTEADTEAEQESATPKENRTSPPRLAEAEPAVPRLLANRPVLRWLRTGNRAAASSSTFDRFLADADADPEPAQRELAKHLAASPQSSLTSMLERAGLSAANPEPTPPVEQKRSAMQTRDDEYTSHHSSSDAPPASFDAEG